MNKRCAVGNILSQPLSNACDQVVVQNEGVKTEEFGDIFNTADRVVGKINDVILILSSSKVFHHGNFQSSDVQLTLLQRIVERSRMANSFRVQSHP